MMTGKTNHTLHINWARAIVSMLVFLFLFACNKPAPIELPPHTPKLVVHGYIETGTVFNVAIGRTFPADQLVPDSMTYVRDATVVLYEDNVLKDTLRYFAPTRYYRSPVIAVVGKTYRLVVSAPGFETVQSITKATPPVALTQLVWNQRAQTSMNGTVLDDVTFTFNDPPGETNYYLAELNRKAYYWSSFCVYSYDPVIDQYQANLNPFEGGSCIDNNEILFTDQQFNGRTRTITVSGNSESLETITDINTGAVYRPFIKRSFISKELYQYMKDAIALSNTSGDPFSIPTSVRGNVSGGYGIFSVFAAVTDTLR
jgi:hypothetical protein